VLALTGALQSITGPVTHILRAQGRAGLHFGYKLCETPLTVLAFVIGLRWSVEGVAVAYTGLQMLVNPVLLFLLARVIGLRFGRLYRALRGPVGATIAMAAAVFLYRYGAVRVGLGATWLLCSEIGVGVVVYAAAIRFGSPGLYRLGSETAKILLTPLVPSLEASRETAEVGASE
jgi:O-antigen/teichoic acid export membrane protein